MRRLHLMNFGTFATPEENILFDINDFDETLPGVDFTVDLKRLAASVAVAALAEGFSKKRARATAAETVEAYRTRMRALAKLSPMEIWHSRIDLAREVKLIEDRSLRRKLYAILTKAGKRLEQDDNFPHLVTGGRGRIADKPPVIYHLTRKGDVKHRINAERLFGSYQTRLPPERLRLYELYAIKDIAFKAVGVGSVGTFCAIGLFMSGDGNPLFLQIKEAGKSVLECLGPKYRGHPGRRVVEGQHIMQASSDIFLGWSQDEASGRHFYVRELKNRRLGAISELVEENALVNYAHLCGRTLARAHARSADPAVLAGYMERAALLTTHWRLSPWHTRIEPNETTINSQKQNVALPISWPPDPELSARCYLAVAIANVIRWRETANRVILAPDAVLGQGCADLARDRGGWPHNQPPGPWWIASPVRI